MGYLLYKSYRVDLDSFQKKAFFFFALSPLEWRKTESLIPAGRNMNPKGMHRLRPVDLDGFQKNCPGPWNSQKCSPRAQRASTWTQRELSRLRRVYLDGFLKRVCDIPASMCVISKNTSLCFWFVFWFWGCCFANLHHQCEEGGF